MKTYTAWLPFLKEVPPRGLETAELAAWELEQGLRGLDCGLSGRCAVDGTMPEEAYRLERDGETCLVTGGRIGVLYGVYALLRALALGQALPEGVQRPFYPARMINCWDNADGSIERGYAGRSLWFEGGAVRYDPDRLLELARLMASVGLNVLCLNNVNVRDPAERLIEDWLPKLRELAALFRPFGIRLMVSVDFAQPMLHGIPTADPLDERVAAWWRERARDIWTQIPDLYGFLVKADSEHRPGPFTYGRSHAEGANMLARAIAPYGGKLVWRAFVYNCLQDWRDQTTDRPCAAYDTYVPLDGQFDANVILQVKNGPFDFQVREPVSPTLLKMAHTSLALEFQLAQEYTGQQIDIYAMAPLFREVFDEVPPEKVQAVAAVSNFGRDGNYFGHPFAAANLFSFGCFAWDPASEPGETMAAWAGLTYPSCARTLTEEILLPSREIYEQYTAPLGLCWMVNPNHHYGPNPMGYEFQSWGTYHRASRDAVGIDRTGAGTGYAAQYPPAMRARYENPETCPDRLLLFFHRLPYSFVMRDGRTLIQRIYDDHFEGAERVEKMAEILRTLPLPQPDRDTALARMEKQLANAREWRDVVNTFFWRFSGVPDAHGRKIYD